MPGKIFISYRRDDVPGDARGVRDGLAAKFGKANVFMDVDNLLVGQRFDVELARALDACDMLIAVIGPRWMDLLKERMASGERDYVREEIAAALARKITVIPVRVGREGSMPALPRRDELPEDIRDLILHQKLDVAHERFGRDMAELIEGIIAVRKALAAGERPGRPVAVPWGWVGTGVMGVLAIGYVGAAQLGVPVWLPWQSAEVTRADPGADEAGRAAEAARVKASADRLAEAEAKLAAEQKARAEAEAKAKQLAEAADKARSDAEARRKADEDALAKAAAEAEAKRKAEEAERQRVAMLAAEEETTRKEAEAKAAAEEAARKAAAVPKVGDTFRDCPECPEMVVVPAGEFLMGSPKGEERRSDDEGPQHTVKIAKPFAVGKYEVTRDEFEAFVQATSFKVAEECYVWSGSQWKKQSGSFLKPGFDQTGMHPAVCVSWDDAKAYVDWLSKKSGKSYRLLTEAEWEYAARAGTTTPFSTGNTITPDQANFDGNYTYGGSAKGTYRERTVEVGSFKPNAFGLYDMHGNVWEWVEDCYKDSYAGAPADGSASTSGDCSRRVLRGGSWDNNPEILRSAYRDRSPTVIRSNVLGFRVGRTLTP